MGVKFRWRKYLQEQTAEEILKINCRRNAEKTLFFKKDKNNFKKPLTKSQMSDKIHHVPNGTYALVAQLDRVTDYESVGRGFESLPSHQVKSHD